MPAVRAIVRQSERDGYRFTSLIEGRREQHAVSECGKRRKTIRNEGTHCL
jgi:hypothetical protein